VVFFHPSLFDASNSDQVEIKIFGIIPRTKNHQDIRGNVGVFPFSPSLLDGLAPEEVYV
jgi:hypothetical protein